MGFYNRPYLKDDGGEKSPAWGDDGHIRLGLPRPTKAVLGIIIACFVVFLLGLSPGVRAAIFECLELTLGQSYQAWRFITFQFVHAGASHIMWNMVTLYFFGPPLEQAWGWKKFLVFYLVCGVFGGVCFDLLVIAFGYPAWAPIVGASAGILGVIMGVAILLPDLVVLFFPVRWVAAFYVLLYTLSVLVDRSLSDGAHLGGMVMAGLWIWGQSRLRIGRIGGQPSRLAGMLKNGSWERKLQARRKAQAEVDRILKKIHDEGITSLTRKERNILQDASRRQQEEDRRIQRM